MDTDTDHVYGFSECLHIHESYRVTLTVRIDRPTAAPGAQRAALTPPRFAIDTLQTWICEGRDLGSVRRVSHHTSKPWGAGPWRLSSVVTRLVLLQRPSI